jgi:hypothetical protein
MKVIWISILASSVAACLSQAATAEPVTVGAVDKVQEQVVAVQGSAARDLAAAGPVYFRDKMELASAPDWRPSWTTEPF